MTFPSSETISPELKIRLVTIEDLPTLNRLYAEMDGKPLLSDTKITEIWQEIQRIPDYKIYLAFDRQKAIGTFSLLFIPTMTHRGFHKIAILDAVTISPPYRDRGFGTQMINQALEISAKAGCYKVTLASNLKRVRTRNFYQALGFKQHGWSFSYKLRVTIKG
jgi:GNAT superfamily N-acetyltransferase